jgi:hypothetical protein
VHAGFDENSESVRDAFVDELDLNKKVDRRIIYEIADVKVKDENFDEGFADEFQGIRNRRMS